LTRSQQDETRPEQCETALVTTAALQHFGVFIVITERVSTAFLIAGIKNLLKITKD